MDDSPDTLRKQCFHCKQFKPATFEYFQSDKPRKDGLSPRCKQCLKIPHKRRHIPPKGHKRCCSCKEDFPTTLEYFGREARRPDGLRATCKFCAKRQWEHYAQSHHERILAIRRNAQQRNPESFKAAQDRYCQTEKGKAQRSATANRRRARVATAPGSFTAQDIADQYKRQKGKCYWCDIKLGKGKRAYHVDHVVPLSRGGSNDISNLVIACPTCNMSKNDRLPHEWPEGGRLL